ncbi:diguanylate cyclase [Palleronia sp. KMU-117]|uniref:diguanylate cyclase n=1 Tax=Palleronia sp. KMU-117 TaxID=3434108 RepID=UPI003D72DE66
MAGRILIVDDQTGGRLCLRVRLTEARYDVTAAASGAEALAALASAPADLAIVDATLGDVPAAELCRRMKADPGLRDIPVLILSDSRDRAGRIAALRAGAEDVMAKPVLDAALLARVRSLLRVRETRSETRRRDQTAAGFGFAEAPASFEDPGRIALVAADAATGDRWRDGLGGLVPDRVEMLSPDAALDEADRARAADAFVIDADLPRPGGGLSLVTDLRSRPGTRHAAILFAHRDEDAGAGAAALDLGANDLLPVHADPAEIAIRLRAQLDRKRESDRLRRTVEDGLRLAATDALTGLFNRRYALAYLDRVAREAATRGQPYAVMLADLDHFKRVNDTLGHAAGDVVLRTVATRIRDALRGADMVARLGGEEFLIVMPETDFARALPAAERLCRAVADQPVPLAQGAGAQAASVRVTVSIGVAVGGGPGSDLFETPHALIEKADRALYRAKAQGRNTVTADRPEAA